MKLEKSTPEDAKECVEWMMKNLALNDCSPRTLKGCTFFKIAGILYLPVKPVLLLESLAPNPAIRGSKRLLALKRAMDDLRKLHPNVDIIFLTRKDARLAECAERYGFEEKPYVVYQLSDPHAARNRAKAIKKSVPKARLQNDARGSGQENSFATRSVRHLRKSFRPGSQALRRSLEGDRDYPGHPMQAV